MNSNLCGVGPQSPRHSTPAARIPRSDRALSTDPPDIDGVRDIDAIGVGNRRAMHAEELQIPPGDSTRPVGAVPNSPDLVCLSHLRWDFVYQRPQHLLSRCARGRRVFFVEEPVFQNGSMRLEVSRRDGGGWVAVPHLPEGLPSDVALGAVKREMVDRLFREHGIREHVLWYYTPMALDCTRHLKPLATVYDCMDELS